MDSLSKRQKEAFDRIIERAAAHVMNGVSPEEALIIGLKEDAAFVQEMIDGKTDRAQIARKAMTITSYRACRSAAHDKECARHKENDRINENLALAHLCHAAFN